MRTASGEATRLGSTGWRASSPSSAASTTASWSSADRVAGCDLVGGHEGPCPRQRTEGGGALPPLLEGGGDGGGLVDGQAEVGGGGLDGLVAGVDGDLRARELGGHHRDVLGDLVLVLAPDVGPASSTLRRLPSAAALVSKAHAASRSMTTSTGMPTPRTGARRGRRIRPRCQTGPPDPWSSPRARPGWGTGVCGRCPRVAARRPAEPTRSQHAEDLRGKGLHRHRGRTGHRS